MTKKSVLISTILSAALFCGAVTLAQEPVEDINKNIHPDLATAQHHVVQANSLIIAAQKNNKDDMQGHAEKARDLLGQTNRELKLAAEAAGAADAASQKEIDFESKVQERAATQDTNRNVN
jgi:hypothetical protein